MVGERILPRLASWPSARTLVSAPDIIRSLAEVSCSQSFVLYLHASIVYARDVRHIPLLGFFDYFLEGQQLFTRFKASGTTLEFYVFPRRSKLS